jgi:hypothetical protein
VPVVCESHAQHRGVMGDWSFAGRDGVAGLDNPIAPKQATGTY